MPDYTDSVFKIGWDLMIGAPVFWRETDGGVEVVYAFDTVPQVPLQHYIVEVPIYPFWQLWCAAIADYSEEV